MNRYGNPYLNTTPGVQLPPPPPSATPPEVQKPEPPKEKPVYNESVAGSGVRFALWAGVTAVSAVSIVGLPITAMALPNLQKSLTGVVVVHQNMFKKVFNTVSNVLFGWIDPVNQVVQTVTNTVVNVIVGSLAGIIDVAGLAIVEVASPILNLVGGGIDKLLGGKPSEIGENINSFITGDPISNPNDQVPTEPQAPPLGNPHIDIQPGNPKENLAYAAEPEETVLLKSSDTVNASTKDNSSNQELDGLISAMSSFGEGNNEEIDRMDTSGSTSTLLLAGSNANSNAFAF